jgi:hypothetical protein
VHDLFAIVCPVTIRDNRKSYLAKAAKALGFSPRKTKKLFYSEYEQRGAALEMRLKAAEALEREADELAKIDLVATVDLYRRAADTLRRMAEQ